MSKFLSTEEEKQLREQHRQEKNGRIKAVLLSNKSWTYQQIAEALLLDDETISKHVKAYKDSKKLHLSSGGSETKLNAQQADELITHVCDQLYGKAEDICAHVLKTYGIHYTVSGMTYWLQAHGFSYKRPKGTPAQTEWIEFYEGLMTKPENEPIEFGDGVHPTMSTKIAYGWIRTGQDKRIKTTGNRERMNLKGSLNLESMDVTIQEHDRLNSEAMSRHFDLLKKKYPTAPKIHLILDRGGYNRSAETQKAAEKRGRNIALFAVV